MVSATAIGILLYTIPFVIIAFYSLREYLKDKKNSQRKHVYYAFISWSVGFTLSLIGALLVSPNMSETMTLIVNTLFRLFDAFNVIGLFWLFIFLKDFVPKMEKYIIPSLAYVAITLLTVFLTPAGFTLINMGDYNKQI